MFCLVYAIAAEVAFHLHIKVKSKNTSIATTQNQKYFENISSVHVQIQLKNLGRSYALNQHLKTDLQN